MKEEWLMSGAVVPVDVETTAALLVEIKRLIHVVGGMALEISKQLMESYDKGVEDTKQEAIVALEKTVAVMVAAEREACAKLAEQWLGPTNDRELHIAEAIRARGTT